MDGQRIQFVMDESNVLDLKPAPDYNKGWRVAHCLHCGRFCKVVGSVEEFNGDMTQLYTTFDCSKCGTYTESMW